MRIGRNFNILHLKNPKKIVLFLLTFVICYVTLMSTIVSKKYDLKEGDIAKSDIKASRDIEDKVSTEALKKEASEKIDKQYSLKTDIQKQIEESLKGLFTKLTNLKDTNQTDADKVNNLNNINKQAIKISKDDYDLLISLTKDQLNEISNFMVNLIEKVYSSPIEEDKQSDIDKAKTLIETEMQKTDYNKNLKSTLINIAVSQIQPNFFFDKEKTDEKIKEALNNVAPVMIKKNQIVVKEGEPVTASQIKILGDLGLLNESRINLLIYLTLGIFVAVPILLQYYYMNKFGIDKDISNMTLISTINIISLVLARTLAIISPNLIPLACAPILLTLLINYKISMIISLLNCVLIAGAVGFSPEIIILSIVNTILGATSLRKIEQRNDILYSTLLLAAVIAVVSFGGGMLLSTSVLEVLLRTGYSVIGCLFSGVLAVGLLPFFESTFDIVTTVKLLELSNPNQPLLKKLIMEAPGTYHHSMLVANLAEVAAEEVGGNPVLARIGAYYHDVGKIKRPYFFKENQIGKDNPHSKITPNLSTMIVTSHVKDGLELAKEYNLPTVIQDIIVQHHGTTLVKYFYITMKNTAERPEEIREEDFKYPGPIPESKEAAIIMLADSVEAAVRSINEPTKGKIEEMVNNIIKDKLYSGQLDNCDLTLKDINKIKLCFLKALNGIYHQRIEYPQEKS